MVKVKRSEVNYEDLSPMMKQYMDIKKDYEEELLFYRIGDFYELFFEDGIIENNGNFIKIIKVIYFFI